MRLPIIEPFTPAFWRFELFDGFIDTVTEMAILSKRFVYVLQYSMSQSL